MRNILSLSSQIKYLRDIPQVFISFDEQSYNHLYFTIIIVRVLKAKSTSIQEMFEKTRSFLEYVHDRSRTVGFLRKKYPKEATVFRVKVSKEQFLRRNHSVDLYKARQAVVAELTRVVGEVRDFNGGMITKQNELLIEVRDLLADKVKHNELMLENFFYSLTPVIMRTVLEPEALKTLFLMLLDAQEYGFFSEESYSLKTHVEKSFVFAMISAESRAIERDIKLTLEELKMDSSALAMSYVKVYDTHYLGYVYRSDDADRQREFCELIQRVIEEKTKNKLFPLSTL